MSAAEIQMLSEQREGVFEIFHRDRRTLLDKLANLLVGLPRDQPVTVVADAYYALAKFTRALLASQHHLVTRLRSNAVACLKPSARRKKRPWRPAAYGAKSKLKDWFRYKKDFLKAPSPVCGEKGRRPALIFSRLVLAQLGPLGSFRLDDSS